MVNYYLVILLWSEDLGRGVVGRIAGCLKRVFDVSFFLKPDDRVIKTRLKNESHAYRKSKVRQLNGGIAVRRRVQQVLRLQVSMGDVVIVEVFEGDAYLVHDLGGFAFGEGAVLSVLNALEKLAAFHATVKILVHG